MHCPQRYSVQNYKVTRSVNGSTSERVVPKSARIFFLMKLIVKLKKVFITTKTSLELIKDRKLIIGISVGMAKSVTAYIPLLDYKR